MPQNLLADAELNAKLATPDWEQIPSDRPGFLKFRLVSRANIYVETVQDCLPDSEATSTKTRIVSDTYKEIRHQRIEREDIFYVEFREIVKSIMRGDSPIDPRVDAFVYLESTAQQKPAATERQPSQVTIDDPLLHFLRHGRMMPVPGFSFGTGPGIVPKMDTLFGYPVCTLNVP